MLRSLIVGAALAVAALTGATLAGVTTASAQYYGYGYPRYADPYASNPDPYFYPNPTRGPMADTEIYPKPPLEPYHIPLPPKVPNYTEPYVDKSGLQPYSAYTPPPGPYAPPPPAYAPDYQGYAPQPESRGSYVEPYDGGRAGSRSEYEVGANGQTTRTEVANPTKQPPGTIVIDTASRQLYFTEPNGQAIRYGIGVGREGFSWKGTATVQRKAEWPEWIPPSDMVKRRPDLPERMEGGIDNPLGARALYLYKGKKDTMFRIHGTNEPDTIGQAVSSGCIRMMNGDVVDLYRRVPIGTKVVVL